MYRAGYQERLLFWNTLRKNFWEKNDGTRPWLRQSRFVRVKKECKLGHQICVGLENESSFEKANLITSLVISSSLFCLGDFTHHKYLTSGRLALGK
jgi:hypothetical protein